MWCIDVYKYYGYVLRIDVNSMYKLCYSSLYCINNYYAMYRPLLADWNDKESINS